MNPYMMLTIPNLNYPEVKEVLEYMPNPSIVSVQLNPTKELTQKIGSVFPIGKLESSIETQFSKVCKETL